MKPKKPTVNQTIDNQDWAQLYSDAVTTYKAAVWMLADIVNQGKKKFGRNNLLKITELDLAKLRWLCELSDLPYRDPELLPELHLECKGLKKMKPWIEKAKENRWKVTELRKAIREQHKELTTETKIDCAKWPKNILLTKNELNQMTPEQKAKALEHIKTTLGL